MEDGSEVLKRDLEIVAAMSRQMPQYVRSDVLFWSMGHADYPMLTLGGFLMRVERLQKRSDLLAAGQQRELTRIAESFKQLTADHVVRFGQNANEELGTRARQWTQHVNNYRAGVFTTKVEYATDVAIRVIADVLVRALDLPPYRVDEKSREKFVELDAAMRIKWQPGGFVWPEVWQPVYDKQSSWWLYGTPNIVEIG